MPSPVAQPKTAENGPVIHGAPEGHDARILARMARDLMPQDRVLLHVALDDVRTATIADLLAFFAPDVRVVVFPAWDCLPYDRVSPNGEIIAKRVAALTQLLAWDKEQERYPRIVLTTVNAAIQRVMPRTALENSALIATQGGRLDIGKLQDFLVRSGYSRTETVREAGEYAIRGGIIDLFPPGQTNPVRMDLFGDEIETLRTFDPVSQRTLEKIKSFALQPVTEFFLDEDSIGRFRSGYRETFGAVQGGDPLYESGAGCAYCLRLAARIDVGYRDYPLRIFGIVGRRTPRVRLFTAGLGLSVDPAADGIVVDHRRQPVA